MDELFSLTLKLHGSFVGILLLMAVFNYFFLNKKLDLVTLKKRVRAVLPSYYLVLSLILFTGLVLLGAVQFKNIYFVVVLMITVWLFVLVMSIKTYKKMKFLQTEEIESYVVFYKKKYIIDTVLLFVMMGIAYMAV